MNGLSKEHDVPVYFSTHSYTPDGFDYLILVEDVLAKQIVEKVLREENMRVSTTYESQKSSIEAQENHYREYIYNQPNWILEGICVDYGR